MTSTQNGSRGWSLEICHVFSDFTAFEQQFYCSFLWIGVGGHTIGHFFCGCLTPFRSLNERSYIRFIYNYSLFVNSQPPCQILCDDSVYICKSCHSRVQKNFTCSFVPFYTSVQKKVPCHAVVDILSICFSLVTSPYALICHNFYFTKLLTLILTSFFSEILISYLKKISEMS